MQGNEYRCFAGSWVGGVGGGDGVVGAGQEELPVALLLGPVGGRADDQVPDPAHEVQLEDRVREQGGDAGQVPSPGAGVAWVGCDGPGESRRGRPLRSAQDGSLHL